MNANDSQKYGQFSLDRGGQPRGRSIRVRTAAEIALDERIRQQFLRCLTPKGSVPSRGVQEIREGRQAPWRANARRVLEMRDSGVATEAIKAAVVQEMEKWIDEVCADQPDRAA
jgi:hypothetical protein